MSPKGFNQRKGKETKEATLPFDIQASDVERMGQLVQEILANGHISPIRLGLLSQVREICLWRKAREANDPHLDQLTEKLLQQQDVLCRDYGFNPDKDIPSLNLWVARQKTDDLLRQVEAKMAQIAK